MILCIGMFYSCGSNISIRYSHHSMFISAFIIVVFFVFKSN